MAKKVKTVDSGGSPAAPYFGEGGRREATAKARAKRGDKVEGNVTPTAEGRGTGVDGGPGTRKVDEAGREVVPAQVSGLGDTVEPGATDGVEAASNESKKRSQKEQPDNAVRVTGGEGSKAEPRKAVE